MPINMEGEPHIFCNSADHSTIEGNFKVNSHPFFKITSEDNDYRRRRLLKRKITVTRDPTSHRIIEKRRRDRMNNCLSNLSKLIPADYLKKGRGRIEKAEIVEMAIEHLQHLQKAAVSHIDQYNSSNGIQPTTVSSTKVHTEPQYEYKLGYQECLAETIRFLEQQGFLRSGVLCVKLVAHLQKHYETLMVEGNTFVSNLIGNGVSSEDASEENGTYRGNEFDENNDENITKISGIMHVEHASLGDSDNAASNPYSKDNNGRMDAEILFRRSSDSYDTSEDRSEDEKWATEIVPNNDSHPSTRSLFKFKTLIRERFERTKTKKSSFSEEGCNAKEDLPYFSSESSFSQFPLYNNQNYRYQNESQSVPIFVLSSQGSFYVPSRIDSNLIAAFIPELRNNTCGFSSVSLHPVTISVNFNHSCMQGSSLEPSASRALSIMRDIGSEFVVSESKSKEQALSQ